MRTHFNRESWNGWDAFKEMFNILRHMGNVNQNYLRLHLMFVHNTNDSSCFQKCGIRRKVLLLMRVQICKATMDINVVIPWEFWNWCISRSGWFWTNTQKIVLPEGHLLNHAYYHFIHTASNWEQPDISQQNSGQIICGN